MARRTVQDLMLQRFDRLEAKMDSFSTEKFPNLLVEVAKLNTKIKEEAKTEIAVQTRTTRIWAGIGGGLTLIISAASLVIAYMKH